ncbi:MAG TPA: aminotransferase class I/II-fold pyridoxal phosphate-dependent enzyme [Terriglobales bacterium]|nr:aminotransferase class I/II-fold pyridoxal phosphate-dependent enzyme [Terriglobales bacterium]
MNPTTTTALRLASRLEKVGFSDIVQIRNKVMELRAQGKQVHQFEGGEPFMPTPDAIKQAMDHALRENKTRYAASSGIAELREAIVKKVNERNHIPVAVEDVIVMNGGMHGLFGSFQTVLDPGDEVLMFSPFWTPIKDLIQYCQATPVYVSTEEARASGIASTLAKYSTSRTRAVYYNTPQNPSGVVFTRAEAEEVAGFTKDRELVVFADEAYEDLVYDGEHFSIASLPGMLERTITTFTMSKSYAMTGWRLGYVVAKEPWMTGLRKTTLYSTNGVSTPTQWAGVAAVNLPVDQLHRNREEYRKRRDLMIKGLNDIGLKCAVPPGAFYAFPDVTSVDRDSRKAAAKLLDAAQVATVPGIVFGDHGEGHLRFSFSTTPEAIRAGLESLKKNL